MLVFLQTLLMLRAALVEWLLRRLRGANTTKREAADDDLATAEYDEERGVVFYPPVYSQRYAAVSDLLCDPRWCGRLEKVVDLGYHDISFIRYLQQVPGVRTILGVDVDNVPLSNDLFRWEEYTTKREQPLSVILFRGNAADPDYRLIGCDAVVAIEMIEHMLPHDLERLVHTVFGFIRPWVAIFTTPNADFNVLFKNMLPNGFRHNEHFFEWTRDQFHEWCSNIVLRYPHYTVYSQGVGPGPPDTTHLGCCTQLALFVNNDYKKRADLTPDALSLVTKVTPSLTSDACADAEIQRSQLSKNEPTPLPIPELAEPGESQLACKLKKLCVDKDSQCNIEQEKAKGYLMESDDDESGLKKITPGRKVHTKIYKIEDVTSRLNCSTVTVRRFSEESKILMVDTKSECLLRTQEVIGELKHLTQILNLNRSRRSGDEPGSIWNNINWGDNAPYWNQYYTIVKEYEYPVQTKSRNQRILDLVTDEIHRTVDAMDGDTCFVEDGRLEIPLDQLMPVVRHFTEDVEIVRELLEWNGYEVVDNNVVYTRLVAAEEDRCALDNSLHWDSEALSTEASEVIAVQENGRLNANERILRAIDSKLHHLREVLSDESSITVELESVVDKLACLALRHLGEGTGKLHARWMQYKLFDLLALSEKAIQRRNNTITTMSNSTPEREYLDSLPEVQISISSICLHKNDNMLNTSLEDEDQWPVVESEEVQDSEEALNEELLYQGCLNSLNMSRKSETNIMHNSYNIDNIIISTVNSREILDRNISIEHTVKRRKSSSSKRKRQIIKHSDVSDDTALKKPIDDLKGVMQCFQGKFEKRKKSHKKKYRKRISSKNLKHIQKVNDTRLSQDSSKPLKTMIRLPESEENSSMSREINVYQLSTDNDKWPLYDTSNRLTIDDFDSSTAIANNNSEFVSYYVSDNKVHGFTLEKRFEEDFSMPSTSTGVRHTAINVQCDATPPVENVSFINTSTSPTKMWSESNAEGRNICKIDVKSKLEVCKKDMATSNVKILSNRRPQLDFGGLNLHCFRDRRKTDDIVYHGQWQKCKTALKVTSNKVQNANKHLTEIRPKTPEAAQSACSDARPTTPRSLETPTTSQITKMNSKDKVASRKPLTPAKVATNELKTNVAKKNVTERSAHSCPAPTATERLKIQQENIKIYKRPGSAGASSGISGVSTKSTLRKPTRPNISYAPSSSNKSSPSPSITPSVRNKLKLSPKVNIPGMIKENKTPATKVPISTTLSKSSPPSSKPIENNDSKIGQLKAKSKHSVSKHEHINNSESKATTKKNFVQKKFDVNNKKLEPGCSKNSKPNTKINEKENKPPEEATDFQQNLLLIVNSVIKNLDSKSTTGTAHKIFGRKEGQDNSSDIMSHLSKFSFDNTLNLTITNDSFEKINENRRETESGKLPMSLQSSSSDSSLTEDDRIPSWLFNMLNSQVLDESAANLADGSGATAVAQSVEDAGAGAGDGRGVHLSSSLSDDYSSSLLSTDTDNSDPLLGAAALQALNLDGFVRADGHAPGDNEALLSSSSSSTATGDTWIPVEEGDRSRHVNAPQPNTSNSTSGVEADVSSIDA